MSVPSQGNETRTSILPSVMPSGIGFLGSSYSPADSLLTPSQIGVSVGNSMDDVGNAVKGVAFYSDMIGFGAPSTSMTQGMPLKPLGVNYFMKTGMKCSNGADMHTYFKGIPEGNALGNKVKDAMAQMGLPPLKGLAPGMIEDAENGLNPMPLMNSLFGSGYPQCKQVTEMVGDLYGKIQGDDGKYWIDNPQTAKIGSDGLYYQTTWVQDTDTNGNPITLTRDQWEAVPKTLNADGTTKTGTKIEGFGELLQSPVSIATIGVLSIIALSVLRTKI
jgi:hypothetical protein